MEEWRLRTAALCCELPNLHLLAISKFLNCLGRLFPRAIETSGCFAQERLPQAFVRRLQCAVPIFQHPSWCHSLVGCPSFLLLRFAGRPQVRAKGGRGLPSQVGHRSSIQRPGMLVDLLRVQDVHTSTRLRGDAICTKAVLHLRRAGTQGLFAPELIVLQGGIHHPKLLRCEVGAGNLPFVDLSRAERFGIEESNDTSGLISLPLTNHAHLTWGLVPLRLVLSSHDDVEHVNGSGIWHVELEKGQRHHVTRAALVCLGEAEHDAISFLWIFQVPFIGIEIL
mmetsp:Transcript_5208/g.8866  ORF Transcript_5208/g.8866 Transcript_5208/m.8866 type:complete len:281 (+) Transcript_5208:1254-2096(+)